MSTASFEEARVVTQKKLRTARTRFEAALVTIQEVEATSPRAPVASTDAATQLRVHRQLFELVHAAITVLEVELGAESPRHVRQGPLGEAVAIVSSGASEGLKLIAASERQLAG